jgi:tripartite ATP-independent transporter DctP family solute receptor
MMTRCALWAFRGFLTLCALPLLALTASAADYQPSTIRFADVINRNFGYYQGMLAFKKAVEERSGGKIKVELLTDGVMGTAKDLIEAVQIGTVQIAMNTSSYTQTLVPEHSIFTLPYLFKDFNTWRSFAYGPMGKELGNKLEAKGVKFLSWCFAGGRGIVSKRPMATPADFKGAKIRSLPDSIALDTISSFGAQPVVMNVPEVFTSLQQGIIDGADVSIELVTALKLDEVAKYYTETQHIFAPGIITANLDWWNGLNADTKALIDGALADFLKANDSWFLYLDPTLPADQQAAKASMLTQRGVTVVKPDLEQLRAASRPVIDKYAAKVGVEYLNKVKAAVGYQ